MIYDFRVGEKTISNNELLVEITAYRGIKDIDVIFEDGVILEHVSYARFFQGHFYRPGFKYVRWPYYKVTEKYIGKKKRTLDGYRTLLAVHEDGTIDYEDDNGQIVVNGNYIDFKYTNIHLMYQKIRGEIVKVVQ